MRTLVLYLNELSCGFEGLDRDNIRTHVVNTIATVRAVAIHREDTVLRMHCRLAELTLGAEHTTLGAILGGPNDLFTRLKGLLDRAPCGPVTRLDQEIRYGQRVPIGMTWADIDGSFVFGFGHCAPWTDEAIQCQRHVLDRSSNVVITATQVCNLATTAHADAWQQRIQDFGKDAAKSSLLYEGTGFFMRMHLHDHDPAHVHIYPRRGDTGDRIARVRIDNCDKLDGSLSSAMDHEITNVITSHRTALLEGWRLIQQGRLPLRLD
jgi:Domain of unknown function (DUF4160)